jgi:hypothetical protein
MVNGSQLFDGCTIFVAADREGFEDPLMAENGSERHTVLCSSKFEAQHMPNPVAPRDGSYLAALSSPVRHLRKDLRKVEEW